MSDALSISSISEIDKIKNNKNNILKYKSEDYMSIEDSVFDEFTETIKYNETKQHGGKNNTESNSTLDIDDIIFSPPFEYSELEK